MNAFGSGFCVLAAFLQVALPRRWAALPLLLSVLYMTRGQALDVAGANFTVLHIVVAVGWLRVWIRGEGLADGLHGVDVAMLTWAALLLGTGAFHAYDGWLFRSGLVWTTLGSYFLLRVFLRDLEDVRRLFTALAIAMVPLALLMLFEKTTDLNPFGPLGGVNPIASVRRGFGYVRAQGPFAHPILAGTVGATAIGIGLALRGSAGVYRRAAMAAGAAIVVASGSSGPILMAAFVVLARAAWALREHMRAVRWSLVAGVLALAALMNDPVYFVMARIDISGGSQGYFRAQLIRSSIEHLSEWWATGTDYTRHWMPSGIVANDRHTDMTNHFLQMGVMGGLVLAAAFVCVLVLSFRDVGRGLRANPAAPHDERILIWSLGALLVGYFMTFWSISLFDHSIVFYNLVLASIQAVVPVARRAAQPAAVARQSTTHHVPRREFPTDAFGPRT
jgi:hypothetical protein